MEQLVCLTAAVQRQEARRALLTAQAITAGAAACQSERNGPGWVRLQEQLLAASQPQSEEEA